MNRRLSDHALVLLRVYIGGNAVVTWYNAVSDPRSLVARLATNGDGMPLVWFLGFCGILVVLDAIINDLLPKKYTWNKAVKNRHLFFGGLACCYVGQLFVGVMSHQVMALLVYYVWNASIIMLASFLDAKKRSRDAECAMLYN